MTYITCTRRKRQIMQCSIFVKISLIRFTSKHGWRKRSYCWVLFAPKTTDKKNFGSWRKLNRSDFINSRIYAMLFLMYWTSIIFIRLGWHLPLKQRESRIFMKAFDRFFLTLHLINQKIVKALVMLVQWSKVKTNKRTKTNNGPHKNTHKSSYWVIRSQLKSRKEVMCSEE